MSTAKHRSAHARAILGPELYSQLGNTNVLLVGAGGIGCELRKWPRQSTRGIFTHVSVLSVKTVVMTGFGKITLLDLDTIDLSNLNRQFLFKKKDVKQSKALVRPRSYIFFYASLLDGNFNRFCLCDSQTGCSQDCFII